MPTALLTTSSSGGFGMRATQSSVISAGGTFQIFRLYGRKYFTEIPLPNVAYAHSSRFVGGFVQGFCRYPMRHSKQSSLVRSERPFSNGYFTRRPPSQMRF